MIEHIEFKHSTQLKEAHYNESTGELVMTFRSGGRYRYQGVPAFKVRQMEIAPSPGRYFDEHIKKSMKDGALEHPYSKVEG